MTIEELRERKRQKGYTYSQMAELSGVPVGTIQKIFRGETSNPRYDTIQALEKLFDEPMVVREGVTYSAHGPGTYTVEDYYALPDEQRAELIDGYFYDMASPNIMHQEIIGDIAYQIRDFIRRNRGECKAFTAPLDVRLDCDDKTMVQPDVIILCDKDKQRKWGIMGAPDFVLEVISPSTKNKDYALKAGKYMNAGVREYWIIDPHKKVLLVFDFENEKRTTIYRLDEPVSVGIYEGELKISFNNVLQIIDEFENLTE